MNILEMFARIGLKADISQGDQFLKTVKGIKSELESVVFGALSVGAAIKAVNASMEQARGFKRFTAETGQSAEELQKWANVAETVSGAGDSVATSIKAIVANQEKIKLGQGNISGYQLLGIDPRANPFEVLEQLRTKLQNVSPAMRRNIASQFGISTELVQTLELSNAEFEKMAARAWIIPQSNIDGMNKAVSALAEVGNAFKYLQAELATKLAPLIEKVTKGIIAFAQMVTRGVLALDQIVRATIGWRAAIYMIVGALALLNKAFLLSPIGMFTAAVILLLAILEDLYVYSTGSGKSLFGVLVEKFPAMGKAFDWVVDAVTGIRDLFKMMGQGDWSGVQSLLQSWGALGAMIQTIIDAIAYLRDLLKNPLETIKQDFKSSMDYNKESLQRVKDWFGGKISFGDMFAPMGQAGGSSTSTTTIAPTIQIYGASMPQEAATAAAREVTSVLRQYEASKASGLVE